MKKSVKLIAVCAILLCVAGTGAFAKQNVEKHTVHFGINPFSWIWAVYNAEVGVPLTGLVEVALQVNYADGLGMARIFGLDTSNYARRLTIGPVVRLFPALNATGFFVSGRIMYLNFAYVSGGSTTSYNDMTVGVDLGYRYLWEFPKGWGMYLQGYAGVERFILNGEIADSFGFPILPAFGFQLGFHI